MRKLFVSHLVVCIIIALCASSCKRTTPLPKQVCPETYATAYEQIYGHFYDSLPELAVVALDLYTSGLDLDKDSIIRGTGYNLYISDIFVPDSLLEEGEYKSIPQDSLSTFNFHHSTFRFLPGRNYEGTPHGIYLLTIVNNQVSQIQIFDSGSFVYRDDQLQFTLYYVGADGYPGVYNCSFSGPLIPWRRK